MKLPTLLMFIFIFSSNIRASLKSQEIACTHQVVCSKLVQIIQFDNKAQYKIIKAFEKNSDPHHSSLSPLQIKKMKKADIIIRGPKNLNPNLNSLFGQTKKLKIELETSATKLNPHFWLFKEANCEIEKQLKKKLENFKIKTKKIVPCFNYQKQTSLEDEIKKLLSNKKITLILPHNSFTKYLKQLGFDAYSLYKPGHHRHINLSILKKIERLRSSKSKAWFWLLDDTLEDKKYILPNDKLINIKLMSSLEIILKTLKVELSK